jgi:hypothetical protein
MEKEGEMEKRERREREERRGEREKREERREERGERGEERQKEKHTCRVVKVGIGEYNWNAETINKEDHPLV